MKYKLIDVPDTPLYRIEALKDFSNVKKGDIGGFVQSERNLSQHGDCWIYHSACVYDQAKVSGDAQILVDAHIRGHAKVYDHAMITNDALIEDNAEVFGHAKVYDFVRVMDYAKVHGHACLSGTTIVKDYVSVSAHDNFKNLRLQGSKSFATLNDYTLFTINHLFGDFYFISHVVDNEIIFEQKYSRKKPDQFIIYLQSQIPIGDPIFDELSHRIKLNEFKFASQGVNYSVDVIGVMNSF